MVDNNSKGRLSINFYNRLNNNSSNIETIFFKLVQTVRRSKSTDARRKLVEEIDVRKRKLGEGGWSAAARSSGSIKSERVQSIDALESPRREGHNGRVAAELIQVGHVETQAGNGASPHLRAQNGQRNYFWHTGFFFPARFLPPASFT